MKLSTEEIVERGTEALGAQDFAGAEQLYRIVLRLEPDHSEASHGLATVLASAGDTEAALPLFLNAIQSSPDTELFWSSYIDCLINAARLDEAEKLISDVAHAGMSRALLGPLGKRLRAARGTELGSPHEVCLPGCHNDLAEGSGMYGRRGNISPGGEPTQQQMDEILTHYQAGYLEEAESLALSMTKEFPQHPFGWKVHGVLMNFFRRTSESLLSMRRAVALAPEDAEAHYNLGLLAFELGIFSEAEASFTQAIAIEPEHAEAYNGRGVALKEMGKPVEAEASYRDSISLEPTYAEAQNNLGVVLQEQGRFEEAEAAYNSAIALNPQYAEAHNNLGTMFEAVGRPREAESNFESAIRLRPDYAEAHLNLGVALKEQGRLSEAEAAYRKAVVHAPCSPESHSNLGAVLESLGRLDEAEASCRRAIALDPDYAYGHLNLGFVLKGLGEWEEAGACYDQAITLKADLAEAHSNRLMLAGSMQFRPALYQRFAAQYADMVSRGIRKKYSHHTKADIQKKLRVGFVSGDLRSHPVGYFLEGLLAELRASQLELFAYPSFVSGDALTARLKSLFNSWTPLVGLTDEQSAKLIYDDKIDVLIDLSGHTQHNRLPVFAFKPAPVQVSWLGYYASTGLKEMDYLLGDPYVTPEYEATHFSEKIWRLPESFLCFTPPRCSVPVGPLPALANQFFTFGCFNDLSRLTDEVVSLWARILQAVPESKLFLKDKRLGHKSGIGRIASAFQGYGIPSDRLILEDRENRDGYLDSYNRVDLALSPFPYGGGTTSVEGLWMGVPVLAKTGDYFLSHVGESIAHNACLPGWLASDNQEYLDKAIALSSDIEGLCAVREGLRAQLMGSALMDVQRFAKNFEQALTEMRGLA